MPFGSWQFLGHGTSTAVTYGDWMFVNAFAIFLLMICTIAFMVSAFKR